MPVLQATCPHCGVVKTTPDQVWVCLATGEIRFACPICELRLMHIVDAFIMTLLLRYGAHVVEMSGPITSDDLIAFHENFEDEMRALLG